MKQTVTEYEFVNAFDKMDRGDNFTRTGRFALYEHLIQLEEDCGIEMELDVIGICCTYTEYADEDEVRKAYGLDEDEDIHDYTTVIEAGGYNWNGRTQDSTIIIEDW